MGIYKGDKEFLNGGILRTTSECSHHKQLSPQCTVLPGLFSLYRLTKLMHLRIQSSSLELSPLLTSYDTVNRIIIPFLLNSDNISYIIELFVFKYDNTDKVLSTVLETY